MPLVEVGNFVEASEAEVAASALRAHGVPVYIQNEIAGQNLWYMSLALGGVRLLADDADAEAARLFLEACRRQESRIAATGGVTHSVVAALAAYVLGGPIAWALARLWRKRLPEG